MDLPLISIVTPSFNQAAYIRETLQSLLDQNYPRMEVIVQDGGSTDGAVEIAREFAARHPDIFRVFVEKDSGQADALNRGFARTTGTIMGFLNSDDTLYPSCLHRVAREINPALERWVVFGRCLFTGEGSPYVGVEHPSEYQGHYQQLAIWKRGYNILPQPSVFWHRKVWEKEGGFDTTQGHVLDYDLFCRFSRSFRFYKVDELWSTYRMHPVSKSSQRSEAEILAMSIAVSRRYWSGWHRPLRWRCEWSCRRHAAHTHERARHHARRAEKANDEGRVFRGLWEAVLTALYSPKMACHRLLRAWLATHATKMLQFIFLAPRKYATITEIGADRWIGPSHVQMIKIPKQAKVLQLECGHHPQGMHKVVELALYLDGIRTRLWTLERAGEHACTADVHEFAGRTCRLELRASSYFVPRLISGAPDDRKLSLQLHTLDFK